MGMAGGRCLHPWDPPVGCWMLRVTRMFAKSGYRKPIKDFVYEDCISNRKVTGTLIFPHYKYSSSKWKHNENANSVDLWNGKYSCPPAQREWERAVLAFLLKKEKEKTQHQWMLSTLVDNCVFPFYAIINTTIANVSCILFYIFIF